MATLRKVNFFKNMLFFDYGNRAIKFVVCTLYMVLKQFDRKFDKSKIGET